MSLRSHEYELIPRLRAAFEEQLSRRSCNTSRQPSSCSSTPSNVRLGDYFRAVSHRSMFDRYAMANGSNEYLAQSGILALDPQPGTKRDELCLTFNSSRSARTDGDEAFIPSHHHGLFMFISIYFAVTHLQRYNAVLLRFACTRMNALQGGGR